MSVSSQTLLTIRAQLCFSVFITKQSRPQLFLFFFFIKVLRFKTNQFYLSHTQKICSVKFWVCSPAKNANGKYTTRSPRTVSLLFNLSQSLSSAPSLNTLTHTVTGHVLTGGHHWFILCNSSLPEVPFGNGRGDGKRANVCVSEWVCVRACLCYVYNQMTDNQSKNTCAHTHRNARESDWGRLSVISVTKHPVVTEPRDREPFHSPLRFINHLCMQHNTSGGQMSISPPSFVFSPSVLLLPSGRPGVNPSLLHLAQTTHALSRAAVAHQQRASTHVCIPRRNAGNRKPALKFGNNNNNNNKKEQTSVN